jgi:hypothetical protein
VTAPAVVPAPATEPDGRCRAAPAHGARA